MNVSNKLVPASPFVSLRPGANPRVEPLKGASLGQVQALLKNIRLGWGGLSGNNNLAYFKHSFITAINLCKIGSWFEAISLVLLTVDIVSLSVLLREIGGSLLKPSLVHTTASYYAVMTKVFDINKHSSLFLKKLLSQHILKRLTVTNTLAYFI